MATENMCFYNRTSIVCENRKCKNCGWNPANTQLRRERVEEAIKNRRPPKKPKKVSIVDYSERLTRRVYCVELGKTCPSIRKASEVTRVSKSSIAKCLNKEISSTKGFHFEEVE